MEQIERFHPLPESRQPEVRALLESCGLRLDSLPEETVVVSRDETAVATASRSGSVLQYIAVDSAAEGQGLCATMVSRLTESAFDAGVYRLFLFTKPAMTAQFISLGFSLLAETGQIALLENSSRALDQWLDSLPRGQGGRVGAIVANLNPLTNGHLYLMEQAAGECDTVHLFVLSEEKSLFSARERLEMARAVAARFSNVLVHGGGRYIISSATFPAYFIKDRGKIADAQMELDAQLFARRIAPALGISVRFVGTEPFCPVTEAYNGWLKRVLPRYGVELREIPRLGGISAGTVRSLMEKGDREAIRALVPEETYEYIQRHLA